MKRLVLMLLLFAVFCSVCHAREKTSFVGDHEIRAEAERGFAEIMELWHSGNYDGLYSRTISRGSMTRKAFAGRLAAAPFRPACCWKQVQDVRTTVKNDDNVTLWAKVGLEGGGDTQYRVRAFKLRNVDGVWRISRADILSLSSAKKKK